MLKLGQTFASGLTLINKREDIRHICFVQKNRRLGVILLRRKK